MADVSSQGTFRHQMKTSLRFYIHTEVKVRRGPSQLPSWGSSWVQQSLGMDHPNHKSIHGFTTWAAELDHQGEAKAHVTAAALPSREVHRSCQKVFHDSGRSRYVHDFLSPSLVIGASPLPSPAPRPGGDSPEPSEGFYTTNRAKDQSRLTFIPWRGKGPENRALVKNELTLFWFISTIYNPCNIQVTTSNACF